jgi:hypothetical protein
LHDDFRSGEIGRERHVVNVAQPLKALHIRFVRVSGEGVDNENDGGNFVLRHARTDLRIATERPGEVAMNVEPCGFRDSSASGSGGDQLERAESIPMPEAKSN